MVYDNTALYNTWYWYCFPVFILNTVNKYGKTGNTGVKWAQMEKFVSRGNTFSCYENSIFHIFSYKGYSYRGVGEIGGGLFRQHLLPS